VFEFSLYSNKGVLRQI